MPLQDVEGDNKMYKKICTNDVYLNAKLISSQPTTVLDKPDMDDTGETQRSVTWAEVVTGDAQTSKKGDGNTNHLLTQ